MDPHSGARRRVIRNPLRGVLGAPPQPGEAVERFRPSLAFLGLLLYLWVIHSAKAPLATTGIVVALIGIALHQYPIRFPAPLLWFGAFIGWAAVTAPLGANPAASWAAVQDFSKLWLIFLVIANVAHTRRQLHVLMVAWLGVFALYPVRGTLFNFLSGISEVGRYAWNFIFANPNDLAALTLPILALSIAVLQGDHTRGWIRLSALAGVVVLPAIIVLTQSRGGILALFTLGLLVLAQYRARLRAVALGVLAAGVVALAAPPQVWDRLAGLTRATDTSQLGEVDEEGSAKQRFEIWRVATAIIRDHPVAGIGLGNYPEVHREYAQSGQFLATARGGRDTHSLYLNVAAETGVIGFALLLMVFLTTIVLGLRAQRNIATSAPESARQIQTLLIGLVAFMQAGVFASLQRIAFPYLFMGVIASAISILGIQSTSPARQRIRRAAKDPLNAYAPRDLTKGWLAPRAGVRPRQG